MGACGINNSLLACTSQMHKRVKVTKIKKIDAAQKGTNGCLCCLPMDLLVLILGHLSIIDCLTCHCVCKCWHSALSRCQISIQDQEQPPWIVFLGVDKAIQSYFQNLNYVQQLEAFPRINPAWYTTGKLGHSTTYRVYSIPELLEKRFLLSKYGWLLLFSSSKEGSSCSTLFFFSPFSRSKIDLPFLDVSQLNHPVFDISAPPTSPDCIIFAISCTDNLMTTHGIKISICHRGENTWITRIFNQGDLRIPYAINVVFVGKIIYCLHLGGHLSSFNLLNSSTWNYLSGPEHIGMSECTYETILVSYAVRRASDVILFVESEKPHIRVMIELKDPLEVTKKNKLFPDSFRDLVAPLISVFAIPQIEVFHIPGIKFDRASFNLDAWFGLYELADSGLTFNWDLWDTRLLYNRRARLGTTIAWLEPICVPSQSLSWTKYG